MTYIVLRFIKIMSSASQYPLTLHFSHDWYAYRGMNDSDLALEICGVMNGAFGSLFNVQVM